MPIYEVEIIHEPTGNVMAFAYDNDSYISDEDILKQLKVVVYEEVPYEELHQLDLDLGDK